jgi:multiple sugar transport system substrate-binding protein
MKKIVSLFLCLFIILTLFSACGTSGSTASQSDAKTEASTTQEPAVEPEKPAEKVTINYLNWNGGEEMRLQQEAIKEYMEKNPNVEIKGQWVTENYDSKINTLIAANQVPDIYYINEYLAVDWGKKGVALDMAPLFEKMGINMKATYVPSAIFPDGDKVYGLSTGPVCLLLYYNKAMFDQYGVEYPSQNPNAPWTWDQFVDAAKKLTFDTAGNKPGDPAFKSKQIKSYGCTAPSFWLFNMPLLYSNGAGYANADGTASGLESPQGKHVIQSIADLILVHKVAPNAAIAKTLPGTTQAFKNNQLAMAMSGTWEYSNFIKEDIKFGVAPLPMFEKPSNISWAATNQISAKTNNPDEVAKFLRFLTDPDDNPRQLAINFPNKFDWYKDAEKVKKWTEDDKHLPDFKAVIPIIMTEIAVVPENVTLKNFNKLVGEIAQAELDKVYSGSASVDEAVAAIVKACGGQWKGKW